MPQSPRFPLVPRHQASKINPCMAGTWEERARSAPCTTPIIPAAVTRHVKSTLGYGLCNQGTTEVTRSYPGTWHSERPTAARRRDAGPQHADLSTHSRLLSPCPCPRRWPPGCPASSPPGSGPGPPAVPRGTPRAVSSLRARLPAGGSPAPHRDSHCGSGGVRGTPALSQSSVLQVPRRGAPHPSLVPHHLRPPSELELPVLTLSPALAPTGPIVAWCPMAPHICPWHPSTLRHPHPPPSMPVPHPLLSPAPCSHLTLLQTTDPFGMAPAATALVLSGMLLPQPGGCCTGSWRGCCMVYTGPGERYGDG